MTDSSRSLPLLRLLGILEIKRWRLAICILLQRNFN